MHPLLVEGKRLTENILKRKGTATAEDDAQLRGIISRFAKLWTAHMGPEEECFACELAMTCFAAGERDRLAHQFIRHGARSLRPASLIFPFCLYNLEPDDQAAVASLVPGFVTRFLIPVLWKRSWKLMAPFLLTDAVARSGPAFQLTQGLPGVTRRRQDRG